MNNIVNTISVSSGQMVQKKTNKQTNDTIGTEIRDYSNDKC